MPHIARASTLLALLLFVAVPNLACGGSSSSGDGTAGIPQGCGCLAAGAMGVPGSTPMGPNGGMSNAELALVEEVFAQVNAERAARTLAPLQWHDVASDIAWAHTLYQVGLGQITHDGPGNCMEPTDCLDLRLTNGGLSQAARSAWGENVARGQGTAQAVMCGSVSWMLSQGHCANILNANFTHVGIAVKTGDANGPYWTQVFLRIP